MGQRWRSQRTLTAAERAGIDQVQAEYERRQAIRAREAGQTEQTGGALWQVTVRVPASLPEVQRTALFDAVAEAAHDWEPADRDGWDVDVTGSPVDDAAVGA
jgi:hypothetical protein